MKKFILAGVILGFTNVALAYDAPQTRHRFTEYADVINVQPVYKRVRLDTPSRECWIEHQEQVVIREGVNNRFGNSRDRRRYNDSRTYNGGGGAIIGGVIGGVVGNQLGRATGSRSARRGATIAGAIVGSVIANGANGGDVRRHRNNTSNNRFKNSRSNRNTRSDRIVKTVPVERCRETTHTTYEQQIQAYDVTYRLRGQTFSTRMKRDPGSQLELQVNVAPARY